MTRTIRLLLYAISFVLVQPFVANAAIENPDGSVTLSWSVTYIPFSWKFSIDPVTIQNGSLSMAYELDRTRPSGVQPSAQGDYEILSEGVDDIVSGILTNIQFSVPPAGSLPQGDTAFVFDVDFEDLDPELTQMGQTPRFNIFAGMGDGFNFPVDSSGVNFQAKPGIAAVNIIGFQDFAPVPEPGSLALVSLGALGLLALRRRH